MPFFYLFNTPNLKTEIRFKPPLYLTDWLITSHTYFKSFVFAESLRFIRCAIVLDIWFGHTWQEFFDFLDYNPYNAVWQFKLIYKNCSCFGWLKVVEKGLLFAQGTKSIKVKVIKFKIKKWYEKTVYHFICLKILWLETYYMETKDAV